MTRRRWIAIVMMSCACGTSPPDVSAPVEPRGEARASAAAPAAVTAEAHAPALVCNIKEAPPPEEPVDYFGPKRRATADGVCTVADSNLTRVEDAILALPAPVASTRAASATAWDHKRTPARLALIERRFGLNPDERRRLARDGFVVPARLEQPSYAWAYHEIYQSQLPVYISADSILHAVYAAHDRMVANIERRELAPGLLALLANLHCALQALAPQLPRDTARDLDVYLVVARSLLIGEQIASALGDANVDRDAAALIAEARLAGPPATVRLFGRDRVIDWSQLQPRGHYTGDLAAYFRAAMWLSRLELNLVSRSSRSSHPGLLPDPSETPREAVLALAIAQLVAAAGQTDELARIERAFGVLAGRREDVSVPDLIALAAQAGITDLRDSSAAHKLREAIGDRFQRTARIHFMPQGSSVLPAIATLLGPRIVADTSALRPLADMAERQVIRGGDIAYVLGHDRARNHLAADLAAHPELRANLDEARKLLAAAPRGDDLYTAWLDAIRGLAVRPAGALPSFMDTPAFADLRIDSVIAGYAQLRHNHVLISGQPYGHGGCEIPDGYVEPVPAVYDAIARYADLGAASIGSLSSSATTRDYFARLGKLARVLSALARIELANQPLPPAALQFLSMVTEIEPYGSDGRPTYTGWYFDLFEERTDAIGHADLIADVFTSIEGVSYLGVASPRIGIFVVDTGGGPRAMVGPIAHAYEHHGPSAPRLDDTTARALTARQRVAPWTASYSTPAPPEPTLWTSYYADWDLGQAFVTITAPRALGAVTVELYDHNRVPIDRVTRQIGAGKTRLQLRHLGEQRMVEMMHIKIGAFHAWRELICSDGCPSYGFGALREAVGEPAVEAESDDGQ